MKDTESDRIVVAVVNDLMFGSRIRAAAAQAGIRSVFVRSAADLLAHAVDADLVLLDLETRWLDAGASVAALKADPATAQTIIVAFGSHVNAAALNEARAAGADRVLARSAFVKVLPELLRAEREQQ